MSWAASPVPAIPDGRGEGDSNEESEESEESEENEENEENEEREENEEKGEKEEHADADAESATRDRRPGTPSDRGDFPRLGGSLLHPDALARRHRVSPSPLGPCGDHLRRWSRRRWPYCW